MAPPPTRQAGRSIGMIAALSSLATALVVGSYFHFSSVQRLNAQVDALEQELSLARSLAVDPKALQSVLENLRPAPHTEVAEAPDNWIFGAGSARYTLVEMTDTECPYCRDHFPQVKALIESSAGQINAAILHVPALGEASRRQALAIECAGEQGGSDAAWKYTQAVFDKTGGNGKGVSESLVSLATAMGLDGKRFAACTDSPAAIDRVRDDLDQAIKLGIQQTPSTLLLDNQSGLSMVLQGANASQDGILKAIATLGKNGAAK